MVLDMSYSFQILNIQIRPRPKKLQILYKYFNYRPDPRRTDSNPDRKFLSTY